MSYYIDEFEPASRKDGGFLGQLRENDKVGAWAHSQIKRYTSCTQEGDSLLQAYLLNAWYPAMQEVPMPHSTLAVIQLIRDIS